MVRIVLQIYPGYTCTGLIHGRDPFNQIFRKFRSKALDKREMFGDQTCWCWKWVAKQLKHVWSNTGQTIDTSRWASVVRMPASNMFDTRLSKRTKHRPSNTRTKEMFYVFHRMFDGLPILSNTIKQHQTRCSNGEMFGTKQCLMVFGLQKFPVCPGLKGLC